MRVRVRPPGAEQYPIASRQPADRGRVLLVEREAGRRAPGEGHRVDLQLPVQLPGEGELLAAGGEEGFEFEPWEIRQAARRSGVERAQPEVALAGENDGL